MTAGKTPEKTMRLILDTAARLFMQKGYDGTSLKNIMDETHLSKGAIYYHFSSKEDIFIRICELIGEEKASALRKVMENRRLNGREKLVAVFRTALLMKSQKQMLDMIPYLLNNPKFLAIQIKGLYEEVVPHYIAPILEEGVADGSIQTDHPKEMAEALMTLSNVWLAPVLMPTSPEEMRARCQVYNQLTSALGVKLLDDDLVDALVQYCRSLNGNGMKRA